MQNFMLCGVHFISIIISILIALIIKNYYDYEVPHAIILVSSVYITMFFNIKKYKRELTKNELIRSSIVMSITFIIVFSVPLILNSSFEFMDLVLFLAYVLGTYFFTKISNESYGAFYTNNESKR